MSPFPFLFFLPIFPFLTYSTSLHYPFDYSLHIDCGGLTNSTDIFNTTWLSDRYITNGAISMVSETFRFTHSQEKTLRYFPISNGKKNCYVIPNLAFPSCYLLRTFTVYDNYDSKSHPPSFDVSIEGNIVYQWRSPWHEAISCVGAYTDLFFSILDDDVAEVCFYSIDTDSPVIASLEITQIDSGSYLVNDSSILVNYGRLSSGSNQWGPGFSNDTDRFGRSWQPKSDFSSGVLTGATIRIISAIKDAINVDKSPNYFPLKLYQTAVSVIGGEFLEYILPINTKLDHLLWLHFAEIDVSVDRVGKRVFDVVVNGEKVSRVDIFKQVGSFAAYDWSYVVKNSTEVNVRLVPVVGVPLICGLENYAIIPLHINTLLAQGIPETLVVYFNNLLAI